jgi:hypothetical protein
MLKTSYFDYVYKVDGETIKLRPEKMFEANGVYLIVDKELKVIWIWAGSQSRLFHRYMAANWAGKLKTKKKFYNFKYEVIKQGLEPNEFHIIFSEINQNRTDLNFPGQSRYIPISGGISDKYNSSNASSKADLIDLKQDDLYIPKSLKSHIKKLLSEIKEIQMHVKYSLDHLQQRYTEIEKLLDK